MSDLPLVLSNKKDYEKLRRLFRVKKTELEMIRDRGYRLDYVSLLGARVVPFHPAQNLTMFLDPNFTFEQFVQIFQQSDMFHTRQQFGGIYYKNDPGNPNPEPILVLYLPNDPGKASVMKDFEVVYHFIANGQKNFILITENGLGNAENGFVRNATASLNIQVFLDLDLAFNRLKHAFCPIEIKHIPPKDVPKFEIEEGILRRQLPIMLSNDMIAKWFGAEADSVFQMKIVGTETNTAGFYRAVRRAPNTKPSTSKKKPTKST